MDLKQVASVFKAKLRLSSRMHGDGSFTQEQSEQLESAIEAAFVEFYKQLKEEE